MVSWFELVQIRAARLSSINQIPSIRFFKLYLVNFLSALTVASRPCSVYAYGPWSSSVVVGGELHNRSSCCRGVEARVIARVDCYGPVAFALLRAFAIASLESGRAAPVHRGPPLLVCTLRRI